MRIALLLLAALVGCTTGDGGAVEVSWRFRPSSGGVSQFLDCTPGLPQTGAIDRIELDWDVGGQTGSASWRCTDGHGVTGFEVPTGGALLSVKPLCTFAPAAEGTFIAPALIARQVTAGNTVNLGGVELVLVVTNCDTQPCICQ